MVAFWQGKAKVLSSVSNINVGSRTIDEAIAKWLHEEFKKSTGQECWDKPKVGPRDPRPRWCKHVVSLWPLWLRVQSRLKLLAAAEKAKKTLSPDGVPQARVNIECLLGDHDLTANLVRARLRWRGGAQARARVLTRRLAARRPRRSSKSWLPRSLPSCRLLSRRRWSSPVLLTPLRCTVSRSWAVACARAVCEDQGG